MAEGCPICSGKGVLNFTNNMASIECPCVEAAHQKKRAEGYKRLSSQLLDTINETCETIYSWFPGCKRRIDITATNHFKAISEMLDVRTK